MTQAAKLAQLGSPGISTGFKNRIINGAMMIDQRNAGASVNPGDGQFITDRWNAWRSQASKLTAQQNAGSVTPPTGFTNYLGVTSSSAYSITSTDYFFITQVIEGLNMADLGWGTANAQTVTVSFWVRSSLTGTFSGSLRNGGSTRSYAFSYTISAANTWEQKTVTIAGDTTGTWVTNNGRGLSLSLCIGSGSTRLTTAGSWQAGDFDGATGTTSVVGTNGATFYITGVQLEVGTTATDFEYRDYGRELMMCQRYFEANQTTPSNGANASFVTGVFIASALYSQGIRFAVPKRATPTLTYYYSNPTTGTGWGYFTTGWNNGTNTLTSQLSVDGFSAYSAASLTTYSSYLLAGGWAASAEL